MHAEIRFTHICVINEQTNFECIVFFSIISQTTQKLRFVDKNCILHKSFLVKFATNVVESKIVFTHACCKIGLNSNKN